MIAYKNTPTHLQAVVFHGQHTHVDGYAKDSAMTVILQPSVLLGEATDSVDGPDGRLCITWDKDANGVRNSTGQVNATVSREGQVLTVKGNYYWLKGKLDGNSYSGEYFNPKNELCGSFKLTKLA